jgi:hypothetical protein
MQTKAVRQNLSGVQLASQSSVASLSIPHTFAKPLDGDTAGSLLYRQHYAAISCQRSSALSYSIRRHAVASEISLIEESISGKRSGLRRSPMRI